MAESSEEDGGAMADQGASVSGLQEDVPVLPEGDDAADDGTDGGSGGDAEAMAWFRAAAITADMSLGDYLREAGIMAPWHERRVRHRELTGLDIGRLAGLREDECE
jgi:hypothetical protein